MQKLSWTFSAMLAVTAVVAVMLTDAWPSRTRTGAIIKTAVALSVTVGFDACVLLAMLTLRAVA